MSLWVCLECDKYYSSFPERQIIEYGTICLILITYNFYIYLNEDISIFDFNIRYIIWVNFVKCFRYWQKSAK